MIKCQSQITIIHPLWIKFIQKKIGVLVFLAGILDSKILTHIQIHGFMLAA